ncbi:MAG: DUF4259 domain-containing protein [Myxococcota bacterium]|jgi:hypothetical protein|nr:DUF4259 domain-containing protein [Myxococcota bacterium]
MGTWGSGVFDNDQAIDFVEDLLDSDEWDFVEEALAADPTQPLDACFAADAVTAAEIVAAALGKPCSDLPEGVEEWLADHPAPGSLPKMRKKAVALVHAVRAQAAELGAMWEERPGGLEEFCRVASELEERLQGLDLPT